jgi:lactam utilization protein B
MAAKDAALAKAIVAAVHDFDSSLILYALAGSEMIAAAQKIGMATASKYLPTAPTRMMGHYPRAAKATL